jgi:excisionase family DNA binding protein
MELLTVEETAERLKIAPATVRRYIASGRLPAVRVGQRVRIQREALEGFVEPIAPGCPVRSETESATGSEDLTRTLLRLVGIAGGSDDEDGSTDVSADKYKHLADAYTPRSCASARRRAPPARSSWKPARPMP